MSRIDHAFLAPSSAGIWGPGGCPASPTVEAQYPEQEDSEKAREGTAAHWVASERLGGRSVAVGELAPNGVVVDQDMIDGTDAYVADIDIGSGGGNMHFTGAVINGVDITAGAMTITEGNA